MENQHTEEKPQEKVLSPEEIKKMRAKIIADYKEEIGFLKIQSQYETLLAEIEEAKFRRYNATAKMAQLFAHMEQQEQAMAEYEKAHEEAMKKAAAEQEHMRVVKEEGEVKEKSSRSRRLATPD